MSAHVSFVVSSAPADVGRQFAFQAPTRCIVGREASCGLRLDDPRNPPQLSRRHCELILEPPAILVRDLDSTHGTTINGRLLGSKAAPSVVLGRLFDDDVLGVADYQLRVSTSPVLCSGCLQAITDEDGLRRTTEGRPVCPSCFQSDSPPTSAPSGEHLDAVQRLLSQAHTGVPSLLPLRDYFVERELGRGGMGAVYLARHLPTGRRVAIKIMLPHLAARDDLLARFRREIDNTIALAHPNVVSVFDSGRDNDVYFFTMEYCDGGSVDQLLRRRGAPLSVAEAVPLIRQVLDALDHARSVRGGIIHRDLKPSNLLLTSPSPPNPLSHEGRGGATAVKIADFGLARAFEDDRLTRTADVLCTPHFCPRQQVINSRDVGPEVDVWAAAACLYFLLTRSLVRDHPAGYDALMVATLQPVVPIRQRRPDLPEALADVIDRALVEEPAVPSWTAADFREALLAVTHHEEHESDE
jgi:hypothetical protein